MLRIPVSVQPRPYEALIENGLIDRTGALVRKLFPSGRRCFVVTMPSLRRRWANKVMASLAGADFEPKLLEMPDGERHKRLTTIERLAEELVAKGADRHSFLVALGGGVVGDVTGFLSS